MGQYRAFIEVAGGLNSMRDEMGHVVKHLDALLEGLPVLNAACASFTEGASSYASQRADVRQLHRALPSPKRTGPPRHTPPPSASLPYSP